MPNPLIQFIESQNEQGRARFAALNTDTERLVHLKYTSNIASIITAIAFVILYIPVFSVMYVYFVPPEYRDPMAWKYLIYMSVWMGRDAGQRGRQSPGLGHRAVLAKQTAQGRAGAGCRGRYRYFPACSVAVHVL